MTDHTDPDPGRSQTLPEPQGGQDFRDAYQRALSARHKQRRNRRGKRSAGTAQRNFGRAGYRIDSPQTPSSDNTKRHRT